MPIYPQVKPLDIGEVLRTGSAIQSNRILNRLNEMKIKDAEAKMSKQAGMNTLARQFTTPGQQGPPGGAPLQQPSFNDQQYQNTLMQQYPQEGMKRQQSLEDRRSAEIKTIIDLAKVSPKAAEQRWNNSPLAKESGPIKFMETKGSYSTFKDDRGGIYKFNQQTGEIQPYKESRKGKSIAERKQSLEERKFKYERMKGPKKAYTEATARKRISGIQKAIAGLQSGDKFENALAVMLPEFKAILGQGTDGKAAKSKDTAIQALRDEMKYVRTFLPADTPFKGKSLNQDMGGRVSQSPAVSGGITREQAIEELKRRGKM